MKKIQFTLNVEEGKQMIALGTCEHPLFKKTLNRGKILLKGGTTVSRIAEIVSGIPLRISGRITGRGTVSGLYKCSEPHSILIDEKGQWTNIDEDIIEISKKMNDCDLIICGANAFDSCGRAAFMAGSPDGGNVGLSIEYWYKNRVPVLIPVGIEKMIPGNLDDIIPGSKRTGKYYSWGMSVGLLPLKGELVTEIDAVKLLTGLECQAIGAGGLGEAQGSVTMEAWGDDNSIENLVKIIKGLKGNCNTVSGVPESLKECQPVCENCKRHVGCSYRARMV